MCDFCCVPEGFQLKACFYIHSSWKDLFCFPGINTEEERAAGGANIMLQTHQVPQTHPLKGPVVAHSRGLCSTGREEQDPGCAASPQSRTCCTSIPHHSVAWATSLLPLHGALAVSLQGNTFSKQNCRGFSLCKMENLAGALKPIPA